MAAIKFGEPRIQMLSDYTFHTYCGRFTIKVFGHCEHCLYEVMKDKWIEFFNKEDQRLAKLGFVKPDLIQEPFIYGDEYE